MNQPRFLLKGTFILTLSGILSRLASFYYKVFLSRTIGAKEIALFQITMPVFFLCLSLSGSGIQLAISRYTSDYEATGKKQEQRTLLNCGLFLSVFLSCLCSLILYRYASWIALHFLMEKRCAPLLQLIAFSIPFASIHACICGYYIGKKNITISAVSQLMEELIRISVVFLFYFSFHDSYMHSGARIMAAGQIVGEVCSASYCLLKLHLFRRAHHPLCKTNLLPFNYLTEVQRILSFALPVSLTRILTSFLQSIEGALFPQQLIRYGYSNSSALTAYGTLAGMALPVILFPTAISNAFATLLLPEISGSASLHQMNKVKKTAETGILCSLFPGFFFLGGFMIFGSSVGTILFHDPLSGKMIRQLSLLCPFLYLNITLGSILHGLEKSRIVFLTNISAFVIRLLFLIFCVPNLGVQGYIISLLVSQVLMTLIDLFYLKNAIILPINLASLVCKPILISIFSMLCTTLVHLGLQVHSADFIHSIFIPGVLYTLLFTGSCCYLLRFRIDKQNKSSLADHLHLKGRIS